MMPAAPDRSTTLPDPFADARDVADAVLYEGYVLYPYRRSAAKNTVRWQWGVLAPPAHADGGTGETATARTECLAEPKPDASLAVAVRFLQLQQRQVEAATGEGFAPVDALDGHLTWDEGVEHEVTVEVAMAEVLQGPLTRPIAVAGRTWTEPLPQGRIRRTTWSLQGELRLAATPLSGPFGGVHLRVDVTNTGSAPSSDRAQALRTSLIGTHTMLALSDGRFISMVDPPQWAATAVADCQCAHAWPVLVGHERRVMLSAPIILPDQPQIAPESPGDWHDGLEIDELLVLRTQTLTDAEKAEARMTDPRAAAIIDRADHLPEELRERLHGAVRSIEDLNAGADPATDVVRIGTAVVGKGSRVRLNPGSRRADAQDMFLVGRAATVEAVLFDLDDKPYLAVTIDDDPAAELQKAHGRYLYFAPDEVLVGGGGP
ncbi:hypothetical protein BH23ACT9_BH23ACT9_15850 [soil metagenome]